MSEQRRVLLKCKYAIHKDNHINNACIYVKNGYVRSFGGASAYTGFPKDITVLDLSNYYITPSFIDQNISGFKEFSVQNARDIIPLAKTLLENGTGAFLASYHCSSIQQELEYIEKVSNIKQEKYSSNFFGLHMIGPFISNKKKGFHREEFLRAIDLGEVKEMLQVAKGKIKKMTFSPELKNSEKLVNFLLENEIQPSLGYSDAGINTVQKVIERGANHCTHLFNAMKSIHQRDLGLAIEVLTNDQINCELIFDTKHVDPKLLELTCKLKAPEKIIAVSGNTQGSGLEQGEYEFREKISVSKDFTFTENFSICGSSVSFVDMWSLSLKALPIEKTRMIQYFTHSPARTLGLDGYGCLFPGQHAYFNIFNLEDKFVGCFTNDKLIMK